MNTKKIIKTVLNNYFLAIFISVAFFAMLIVSFKFLTSNSTDIYVKVKMGQGLWWATTGKPAIWFVKAVKKGEKEYDLVGKPIAEITKIRYYESQGDIFLTVKLSVTKNKKTQQFTFKRSAIAVGSPIDLSFPSAQVTGTVIDVSENNFNEELVEKTIYLTKKYAFPWEYDAIKIGDEYFDGEDIVFKVLDKRSVDTSVLSADLFGNLNPSTVEPGKYIFVKAMIKLQKKSEGFVYGEEQVLKSRASPFIGTNNFNFNEYGVAGIE